MASVISMPRLSDTMSEGVLVKWHKQEGDSVEPGDVLADVETDKAVQECEAFEGGTLLKLLSQEGDKIPIGEPIAILGEAGEDVSEILSKLRQGVAPAAPKEEKEEKPAPPRAQTKTPAPAAPPSTPAPAPRPHDGRVLASPVARKLAREGELDLASVTGSGPNGRIVRRDVEAALAAPRAPAEVAPPTAARPQIPAAWLENGESKPLSSMRKTIARRLTEAKSTIPHFYLTVEVDMDEAVRFRKMVHDPEGGNPISFNDLVVKASALALQKLPEAHAGWEGESIRYFARADISVAVSTEEGLITPIIRGADQKSLGAISREIRELAERAKRKRLKPEEFTGGTFSVSNLGMYGIEEFSAIINPPEAAILSVGAIEKKPVVKGDEITVGQRMRLTLCCDHRVVDGVLGAKLLGEIKAVLQKPMRLAL